ncbi:MAG TPA: alpha/beta fold hydrolase [Verrucomicrobiae bacterium]|nr:alpha/beta fold hydrolase [Verrucomicrobiae bacterium]
MPITRMPQPQQTASVPQLALIPGAEQRNVLIDGVNWRYWFAGSGPPLLLIHGFLGYSFSWRFNLEALARDFSVYAIDLPGCGFSDRPACADCTLAGDAERVLRFMEHMGIENADIVGSSRGGGLTIILAALAARSNQLERIRRLILVSPINPWSSHGKVLTRLLATTLGGIYVVHVQPRLKVIAKRYLKALYGDPARIAPGTFDGYNEALEPAGSFEHLLKILRSWHDDLGAIHQALGDITGIPTLLLWGSRDRAVYPSSIHQLQRQLKNSALVMFHGAGHMPYEEVPEEFNRVVCDFLLHDAPRTPFEIEADRESAFGG